MRPLPSPQTADRSITFADLARRHAVSFVYLPAIGVIAGVVLWPVIRPTRYDLVAGLLMWVISMLGITVGYHRLCTHRAFRCGPVLTGLLLSAGCTAANFPVIYWSAVYRRHHQYGDVPGDPHSPNVYGGGWRAVLRGFLHTHFGPLRGFPMPNPWVTVRDLLENPAVLWANRNYTRLALGGLVAPACVSLLFGYGWMGFLSALIWAGCFRLLVVQQLIFTVNSLGHLMGSRPHPTPDLSRNNALVAIATMGEGWHNNHHRFPASAYIGLRWWELDVGGWLVSFLHRVGLVSDVIDSRNRQPTHECHNEPSDRT